MNLTTRQREWLHAILDLHDSGDWVKAADIAAELGRSPGGIRNGIRSLIDLGLLSSKPGIDGGYAPTAEAYKVLDRDELGATSNVPVYHDGRSRSDLVVEDISLPLVHHPDQCCAEIQCRGVVTDIHQGDHLRVGPVAPWGLIVEGQLVGRAGTNEVLILSVDSLEAGDDERTTIDHPVAAGMRCTSDD